MLAGDRAAAQRGVTDGARLARVRMLADAVEAARVPGASRRAPSPPTGRASARCPTARRPCGDDASRGSRCPSRARAARSPARRGRASRLMPSDVLGAWITATVLRGLLDRRVMSGWRPVVPTRIGTFAGDRAVEARPERVGRREIDQHVAMVLIDREAGIFRDGLGDRLAHAPVGRDQADADRLVGGAHDSRSWRKAERRAIGGAPRRRSVRQ